MSGLRLTWFGHAAVGLEGEDAAGRFRRVLIDPYEPGGFGGLMAYPEIDFSPDTILISHLHGDHAHTAPFPGVPVLGPAAWGRLRQGEAVEEASGLGIEALEVDHDAWGGRLRGGTSWMLRLTLGGQTVLHAGDIGELPEAARLRALACSDLCILPCGGFFTLNATEALELALRLQARVVLPLHTRTAQCGLAQLGELERFQARAPVGLRQLVLSPGASAVLKASGA